jgi:hypothetical protein
MTSDPEPRDEWASVLSAKGWLPASVDCPVEAGVFYEVTGSERNTEIYGSHEEGALAAELPLPDSPHICREIPRPSFVKEI